MMMPQLMQRSNRKPPTGKQNLKTACKGIVLIIFFCKFQPGGVSFTISYLEEVNRYTSDKSLLYFSLSWFFLHQCPARKSAVMLPESY